MIKVVLDTNIYISGFLFGGNSREILNLITEGKLQLFISDDILLELKSVLQREKFDFLHSLACSQAGFSDGVHEENKEHILGVKADAHNTLFYINH